MASNATVDATNALLEAVRRHDADATTIRPAQVIVAGIIGAALFVFCLIMVVRYVTR